MRPEAGMTQFDESHDFVVVGSGGGSMCAGLVLREAGKSVLIVEKTGQVGGTTSRSGGVMWIPNNPIMKRDGIVDSDERAATYLDAVLGDAVDAPGATPARRSEEHTSELQSLMRISYAVFCLKKKKTQ